MHGGNRPAENPLLIYTRGSIGHLDKTLDRALLPTVSSQVLNFSGNSMQIIVDWEPLKTYSEGPAEK